jgi:hypothetical protein
MVSPLKIEGGIEVDGKWFEIPHSSFEKLEQLFFNRKKNSCSSFEYQRGYSNALA